MITVRYFAGARDAAGTETETVDTGTLGTLTEQIVAAHPTLADVLPRCSVLADGIRVHDPATPLSPGSTVDVLPPFAGG
ncbi:Molybdopterin converting factor, small subunit [Paraoerskovia marina]|uniref:Molybdopterin synthase sulfur carrier subunit n=1 Tax=Paraoerskovia marina TaxID=545619 RepID=A0A1H1P8N2_9CELL|nr:MoaD/ThiS family protein [Paraoerskovia marina]SDS07636.1 Molybdopterin converting factor, small subunit [Paraoerskovia marina]